MPKQPIYVRRFVGIDPGKATGLAVWDAERGAFSYVGTMTFWDAYFAVLDFDAEDTVIVIELPKLTNYTWRRDKVSQDDAKRMNRISRNVGGNSKEGELLGEGFERLGYRVEYRKPGGKKWNAKTLKQVTGLTMRTSEHARDAVRFVHGRGTRYFVDT